MKLISSLELKDYKNYIIAEDVYDDGRIIIRKESIIDESVINVASYMSKTFDVLILDGSSIRSDEIFRSEITRIAYDVIEWVFEELVVHDKRYNDSKEKTKSSLEYIVSKILSREFYISYLGEVFIRSREMLDSILRITVLSLYLGVRDGLSLRALYEIGIGAILHDIGKIRLFSEYPQLGDTSHILNFHEYELIKTYPILGYQSIEKMDDIPTESKKIVLLHMVWEDFESSYSEQRKSNLSYPRMYENKIIDSKMKDRIVDIVQIAVLFDGVLGYGRCIRENKTHSKVKAFKYIDEYDGTMLSPVTVKLFKKSISPFSIHENVRLSDGRRACIVSHTDDAYNPIVRIDDDLKETDLRKFKDLYVTE